MKAVKYTDAPREIAEAIGASRRIEDFLPTPDELISNMQKKEKITINVDAQALFKFRTYAEKHDVKYQTLINQVLTTYANERL